MKKTNFSAVRFVVCIGFIFSLNNSSAQITYSYGTYTGDGNATKNITWVGFQPEVVFVKADDATKDGWIATSTMAAGSAKSLGAAATLVTGRISAFLANGFRVGNNAEANNTGTIYHFVAFNAGSDLEVGTYTGTGSNQTIATSAFAPEMIWILGDDNSFGTGSAYMGMKANANFGVKFNDGGYDGGNFISAYTANGHTTGGWSNYVNTYHYVYFKANSTYFKQAQYTGDGADGRNYTTPGFQPDVLFIESTGNNTKPAFKHAGMAADAVLYPAGAAITTNVVQNFQANGFQLGSATSSNENAVTYQYAGFSGGNTLPVKLTDYSAEVNQGKVNLKWSTASEINNDYFIIERSIDGKHWEFLKKITGNGNSNSVINYETTDENPISGVSYYRLIQTDYDGHYEIFHNVSAVIDANKVISSSVFPNPITENYTFLEYELQTNSNVDVSIYDQSGKKVKQIINNPYNKGNYKLLLYTDDLISGIYFIKINAGNEITSTKITVIH